MSAMQDFPVDIAGNRVGAEEDVLAARWAAMHKAADAIAKMIGKDMGGAERAFCLYPVGMADSTAADIIEATDDLCTMMQQGLFAILQARENGAEAKVAAKALLNRFEMRRRALLIDNDNPTELVAA